jgi:hypothetical protein
MTKEQEITALSNFIDSLPIDSYLRPWLSDILPSVESDLRGDIIPFVSPRDLLHEANQHRAERKRELEELHAEKERQYEIANLESKRIIQESIDRAEQIEKTARQRLAGDIARLQQALSSLS